MQPAAVQQSLFTDLAADLPDHHQAEFFRNLHEAGIGPNDVELARLLRALQLYKAYYESIPAAVKEVAAEIERISKDIRSSSDAGALLAGQMIRESEHFRQDVANIREHVGAALEQSAEALVSRTAELLQAGIEENVFLPLQIRLKDLAESNKGFDAAITRTKQAANALQRNAAMARGVHLGTYALGALLIVCAAVLASWLYLGHWYSGRLAQERSVLIQEIRHNHDVLLELAKSRRTIELVNDPQIPSRKLLVMKNASGWRSAGNYGVIEFEGK
jgi:hypothetical protein